MPDETDTTAAADSVAALRERAGELDIPGRSKMNAEQLQAAIGVAEANKTAADAAAARIAAAPAGEQTFPVSRLRAQPEILGQSVAVVAAAFADAGVGDNDMLSRTQAEDLIKRSQERPVEPIPEEA